jgi:hypothetical protein
MREAHLSVGIAASIGSPTCEDVRATVEKMGEDVKAHVVHKGNTLIVSYGRPGGTGKMVRSVCMHLSGKFPGVEIIVLPDPRLGEKCGGARVRGAKAFHFSKPPKPIVATPELLGQLVA